MKLVPILTGCVAGTAPLEIIENMEWELARLRGALSRESNSLQQKLSNVNRAHVFVGEDSTLVVPFETMNGADPGAAFYVSDDKEIVRV